MSKRSKHTKADNGKCARYEKEIEIDERETKENSAEEKELEESSEMEEEISDNESFGEKENSPKPNVKSNKEKSFV